MSRTYVRMRLPDLAGYRLERLMGEDPFGWSFLAGKSDGEKRMVRILKSQATQDLAIGGIYRQIASQPPCEGVAAIDRYSQRMVGMPSAVSTQFPGWKGKSGKWKLSSVAYLSKVMEKDGALNAAVQIIHTLGGLHRQGIYHGGLRPENIFLTNGKEDEPEVKVTGFGEMVIPGLQLLEASNLPFYLAPEQLINTAKSHEKVALWDVYSVGVIIYYLLCGHLPRLDRLFRQYWAQPDQMDKLVLISQGQLTRNAGQIYLLLENEKDLVWPDQHTCDREKILRLIVEKCLAFEAEGRFRNLAEVSDALISADRMLAEKEARDTAAATAAPPAPETQPQKTIAPVASAHLNAAITDSISVKNGASSDAGNSALDDIFQDKAEPKGESKKGLLGKRLKSSSLIERAIAAVIAVVAIAMGVLSGHYKGKLAETEKQRILAVGELRDNILKQANNYQVKIAETQESAKSLKENLNEVEEKKARLLSETKMARGLLKETQANGDRFFKLILENKDTDIPGFREKRREALIEAKKHYQQLIEIYEDAPSNFADSTAHAHYYLGRIYKELGDIEMSAKSFAAAESVYEMLMQSERNAEFTENLAVAKRELGNLAFSSSAYNHASRFFDDSTRHWQELANLDSIRTIDANIEINLNSLKIIECHLNLGNRESALSGAENLVSSFSGMRDRYPGDERIVGGLARAFQTIGLIFENSDREKAISAFGQAGNLYAEAIKMNAAVDRYHLGFANCLARSGLLTNDIDRMKKAVGLLKSVVPRNPDSPESLIVLAEVYGALAANQRDGGKLTNAIGIEEEVIELLRPMVMKHSLSSPVELYHAYARRLVHLAELRVDANKFDSSRVPLKEAIDVLAGITQSENAPPTYRRTLATARGLAGFASLRSGDRSSAKSHYALAKEDWMTYMSLNPNDTDAANNARWTSEQLKALQ